MEIKDKIRELRKDHALTQAQLAEKIGVTLRCVQNYESGARYPRRAIIDKICSVFSISYEQLLGIKQRNELESADEADAFLKNANLIFAGGKLSEDDKDKVMLALQKIYWEAKEINRQKSKSDEEQSSIAEKEEE